MTTNTIPQVEKIRNLASEGLVSSIGKSEEALKLFQQILTEVTNLEKHFKLENPKGEWFTGLPRFPGEYQWKANKDEEEIHYVEFRLTPYGNVMDSSYTCYSMTGFEISDLAKGFWKACN